MIPSHQVVSINPPLDNHVEETISVKEFALMLSSRINPKTGYSEKYTQAIRLLEQYGGYVITNDNDTYKKREVSKKRALQILAIINVPPRKGGPQ